MKEYEFQGKVYVLKDALKSAGKSPCERCSLNRNEGICFDTASNLCGTAWEYFVEKSKDTNTTLQSSGSLEDAITEDFDMTQLDIIGFAAKNKRQEKQMLLSTDANERKDIPITTGVLDYFPLAIAEVAKCSKAGNDQHNPNQSLHWDKTKSTDHADCLSRHLVDRGSFDTDGIRHSAKLAWRALALLQIELENEQKKGTSE